MKNGFISKPVLFEASPGYITAGYLVAQYSDGRKVVEQFIADADYKDFCEAVGIVPMQECLCDG